MKKNTACTHVIFRRGELGVSSDVCFIHDDLLETAYLFQIFKINIYFQEKIKERIQWLNSYLDQIGHAWCLSTSLPVLGSPATRFLSAVAPRQLKLF